MPNYPYYGYQPYQPYQSPMADQLMQLRQNQYQPNMQQMPQQQAAPSIVWVQSEAEAMTYPIAPNNAVTLWDSNAPVIYLKQADASGKPSMKIYDLVERNSRPVQTMQTQTVEYATKDELAALAARLDAITTMKESPVKSTSKKTVQKEEASE